MREYILATVGTMEIRDFATLVNKCRLVEEYNKKLAAAKSKVMLRRDGCLKARSSNPLTNQRGSSSQLEIEGSNPKNPL